MTAGDRSSGSGTASPARAAEGAVGPAPGRLRSRRRSGLRSSASITGPNASTASSRLGRSWTCTWDIPSSPYRRNAAASSAGEPRISRSSGGRPAGSSIVRMSASAERASVAGSRPTAAQASSTAARIGGSSSGRCMPAFHSSASSAVSRSIRGPPVPIMIGGPDGRGPRGAMGACRACHQVPSRSACPSWNIAATIRRPSSNASKRRSNGTPNAVNSGSFQPAPRPRMNRPPLTSSSVSAIFASRAGFRSGMAVT